MSTAVNNTPAQPHTDIKDIKKRRNRGGSLLTAFTWIIAIGFFFPVAWMVLTAFKQESDAATNPPTFLFTPTLDQF